MKKISIAIVFIIFLTTNLTTALAATIVYSPTNEFFVNDFGNVLSDETEQEVYNIGKTIQEKTTAQLVVVTVPTTNASDIESYANKLFNRWGIGTKEKNNGVLLIVSIEERDVRIEVGYGLEGAINDAKAGRILDKYAVESLKANNYDTAIIDTVKQLQGEIYTEYNIDTSVETPEYVPIPDYTQEDMFAFIGIIIFILLVIITKGRILKVLFYAMLFVGRGSSGGGHFGGGSSGGGFSGGGGSSRWRRFIKRFLNDKKEVISLYL